MSARTFTPAQAAEVVRRYNNGESSERIAKDIFPDRKINSKTVVNCLRYMGVEVRASASAMNPVVTSAMRAGIIEMAAADGGYAGAMSHYGVSHETVRRYLREVGIDLPRGRKRTYTIDDHAFDALTPAVEYWSGLYWSDGNVHSEIHHADRLTIALKEGDRSHLEKLRAFLRSTHPMHVDCRPNEYDPEGIHPRVRYSVRSNGLCAALTGRGFAVKRTRTPDAKLAESREFWRGCIDGDGSLGIDINGYPYISLAGQLPVIEAFVAYVRQRNMAEINPHLHTSGNLWQTATTGSTAQTIVEHLYDRSIVFLDRKRERARLIMGR